jgi:hypothetical protein
VYRLQRHNRTAQHSIIVSKKSVQDCTKVAMRDLPVSIVTPGHALHLHQSCPGPSAIDLEDPRHLSAPAVHVEIGSFRTRASTHVSRCFTKRIRRTSAYRQWYVVLPSQQQALSQHSRTLRRLACPLRTRRQMRMTAIPYQRHLMIFTDPSRNWISIANLPIQTLFRLDNGRRYPWIQRPHQSPYLIHITRLGPRFGDVGGVFVSNNPIKFFAISEGILHGVHVFANPDVDAFVLNKFCCQGVAFEDVAFKESPEAGVAGGFGFVVEAEDQFSGSRFDAWAAVSVRFCWESMSRTHHPLQLQCLRSAFRRSLM